MGGKGVGLNIHIVRTVIVWYGCVSRYAYGKDRGGEKGMGKDCVASGRVQRWYGLVMGLLMLVD